MPLGIMQVLGVARRATPSSKQIGDRLAVSQYPSFHLADGNPEDEILWCPVIPHPSLDQGWGAGQLVQVRQE
jgi:hypothetical protein